MVQGKDISFAPSNIKRVLRLRKDPLLNAASYEERKANKDYRLEEVLECLCLEGREWVRHKDGRPHFLRRNDLEPMAKGCSLLGAKVVPHKDDTMIPQEMPIAGEAMVRTRETRPRQPRRLDQQQEENRKSFEAINIRMDRMDDQLSFLCYSNQMGNETMYYPYQNTARQFREMEAQGKAREVVPDSEEEESEEMYSSPSEECVKVESVLEFE
ncbi:hypothetical protein PIB30_071451 [Stylosanthes scabra]|uniref:Uncharacterized protein n=1 Tax=Stylosanthes scabra TaxID=79078 RepID=A0ABU6XM53_9FABA|nr:hypothetical protein [Stylosanthes scabra]